MTEPDVGLNTTQLKTRAERRGDRYVINGQKMWISTTQVANKMLLLARTTPLDQVRRKTDGLTLFYTESTARRWRSGSSMGRHAVDSNMIFFDGFEIPVEDRIGEEGRGFQVQPPAALSPGKQRAQLDLLAQLNRSGLAHSPIESELNARIQSFELAYRSQTARPRGL